jgi:hypothetical protein
LSILSHLAKFFDANLPFNVFVNEEANLYGRIYEAEINDEGYPQPLGLNITEVYGMPKTSLIRRELKLLEPFSNRWSPHFNSS